MGQKDTDQADKESIEEQVKKLTEGHFSSFVYDLPNNQVNNTTPEVKHVTIGVFFDGTLNNEENIKAREHYEAGVANVDEAKAYEKYGKPESSYLNDYSNVVKLKELYKTNSLCDMVYIEGAGTLNLDSDDVMDGNGLGSAENGVRGKLFVACQNIATCGVIKNNKNIARITFDIFGFSRGAAAARSFAYELIRNEKAYHSPDNKHKRYDLKLNSNIDHLRYEKSDIKNEAGMFGNIMRANTEVKMEKVTIIIRYIGLFDTVASYRKSIRGSFEPGPELLHLNTALSKATKVIHIEAIDEHRENFALTKIPDAKNSRTIRLVGVHSDIGGGYREDAWEVVLIKLQKFGIWDLQEFEEQLIIEGWYTRGDLRIDETSSIANNKLLGHRMVSNSYAKIPLNIMYTLMNKEKEIFDTEKYEQDFKIEPAEDLKINAIRLWLHKLFEKWSHKMLEEQNGIRKYLPLAPPLAVVEMDETVSIQTFVQACIETMLHKNDILSRMNLKLPYSPSNKEVIHYIWERINKIVFENYPPLEFLTSKQFVTHYGLKVSWQKDFDEVVAKKEVIIECMLEQIYLRELRHRHLHWSAYYSGAVDPHAPAKNRIRPEYKG